MIQAAWTQGARKEAVLRVNGAAVTDELVSLTYEDDLNGSADAAQLGAVCAARIEFVVDGPQSSYAGAAVEISVAGVPLGAFTVTGTKERDGRLTVTARDAMAGAAMEEYYTPSAASGTALGVVRELAAGVGLLLGDMSGITDVPVEGLSIGCTRREMLGRMAALLGRNAHIDRYGRLCLRWYADAALGSGPVTASDPAGDGNVALAGFLARDLGDGRIEILSALDVTEAGAGELTLGSEVRRHIIGAGQYYAGGMDREDADETLARLACTVTTVSSDTAEDITTEETETVLLEAGTAGRGIAFACPYMTQAVLDGIYARLGNFTYRPMTLEFYGDCRIEAGDILTVRDTGGSTFAVPVMRVTHTWDGGVRTTVTAARLAGEENETAGGVLSRTVTRLEAELARFRNLEAENFTATRAKLTQLFADWAQIGTAVINTLEASGINADWINAGTIQGVSLVSADESSGATVTIDNGVISTSYTDEASGGTFSIHLGGTSNGGFYVYKTADDYYPAAYAYYTWNQARIEGDVLCTDVVLEDASTYLPSVSLRDELSWLKYDSGWRDVSFAASFEAYDSGVTVQYRRVGNTVELEGRCKPTAAVAAGDSAVIATLPAGFRPCGTVRRVCHGAGTNTWLLTITTGGEMAFQRYGAAAFAEAAAGTWIEADAVFLTMDDIPE